MRHAWQLGIVCLLVVSAAAPTAALAQRPRRTLGDSVVPGVSHSQIHNPSSPQYADFLPNNGRRFGGTYFSGGNGGYFGSGETYFTNFPGYGAFFGSVGPGMFPYHGNFGFGHPFGAAGFYPFGFSRYSYFFGRPAIYTAADLYGPDLQGLVNPGGFGLEPAAPQVNIIAVPQAAAPKKPKVVGKPQVRLANAESVGRAWRWINIGDKYFTKQEFRQATQRYKEAAEAAPDVVDAWFRQGQSLLASGQYQLAATAFKRGLKLEPKMSEVEFKLDDLYGDLKISKKAHLESLAEAAEKEPQSGDLLLLVGLELFFDGQGERAKPILQEAARMLADNDEHLAGVIRGLSEPQVEQLPQP